MKPRNSAEIVERKGRLCVRIVLADGGKIVYADRDRQGRITYTTPERVPRALKHTIVPKLFKEIDARVFGFERAN